MGMVGVRWTGGWFDCAGEAASCKQDFSLFAVRRRSFPAVADAASGGADFRLLGKFFLASKPFGVKQAE